MPRIEMRSVPRVNWTVPSPSTRSRKSSLLAGRVDLDRVEAGRTACRTSRPVRRARRGRRGRRRSRPRPLMVVPAGRDVRMTKRSSSGAAGVVDDGQRRVRRRRRAGARRSGPVSASCTVSSPSFAESSTMLDSEGPGAAVTVEPAEGAVATAVVAGRLGGAVARRVIHRDRAVDATGSRDRDGRARLRPRSPRTSALSNCTVPAMSSSVISVSLLGRPKAAPVAFDNERRDGLGAFDEVVVGDRRR